MSPRRGRIIHHVRVSEFLLFHTVLILFLAFVFSLFISWPGLFYSGERSRDFLSGLGYTNVELVKRDLSLVNFRVGLAYSVMFRFKATDLAGKTVFLGTSEGLLNRVALHDYTT